MLCTHSTALKTPDAHIYTFLRIHLIDILKNTLYLLDIGRKLHFCFGPPQLPLLCTDSNRCVCKKLKGDSISVPVSVGSLQQPCRRLTNPQNDSDWTAPYFPTTWEQRLRNVIIAVPNKQLCFILLMNDVYVNSFRTDECVHSKAGTPNTLRFLYIQTLEWKDSDLN